MSRLLPLADWKLPQKQCDCDTCKSMCEVPCWPTPEEAKTLIRLGYGPKMMLNVRYFSKYEVAVISPARRGAEGQSGYYGSYGCVLQKRGRCTIHTVCKPIEGRLAICSGREPIQLRDRVLQLWDNDAARRLVRRWIHKYAKNPKLLLELNDEALLLRKNA